MKVQKKIKFTVFIFSFIMFCIQLRIAIMNLIDPPLVDNTYEKEITRNDMPLITICPNNQTNVAKLQEIGYKLTDHCMIDSK